MSNVQENSTELQEINVPMYKRVRTCLKCGGGFISRNKKVRYCSTSCSRKLLVDIKCPSCHKVFSPKGSTTKYCSLNCRDANKSEVRNCLCCTKEFKVTAGIIRRGNDAGKFCSQFCVNEYRVEDKNPNWRGGGDFNYRGAEWNDIKKAVRERDGYKCTMCGEKQNDKEHDVHHIIPYRLTQDDSMENLTTLCVPCHRKETGKELKLFKI